MDTHHGVARVVLAGEEALLLELSELGRERLALLVELAGDRLVLLGQILERIYVVQLGLQL